ncbi:putative actinorhodin transporter [Gemmatimonadetes bacterium T265]|nr:putative actinorhodin transporter [Gemmatimonadetes bacterium T265]
MSLVHTPRIARWPILAVMIVAEVMDLAASTIVNVAGPALGNALRASTGQMQWVIGAYPLTLGAGLVLGGRLGDRLGRRRMFLAGLVGFTLSSLLCAVAPSPGILIACRLLQGVAGAILLPQGLGLLRENFPGPDLAKVFGIFGPILGLAGIVGPVLGGALIAADFFGLGWRLVFLINVPVGVACFVTAWRCLPHRRGDRSVDIDVAGATLLFTSSVLLVLPLGQSDQWATWTWPCLAGAAVGFAAFVVRQRTVVRAGRTPLVLPSIFQRPAFAAGLAGIALFFCSLVGTQLVLTLFLQIGHGFTPGGASIANLPFAVGTAIGATLSGAVLAARFGRTVLQLGAAVQLAGVGLLWSELGQRGLFSAWSVAPGTLVAGIGAGLVIAALFSIVLTALDATQIGSGSGVLSALQSLAASIGVAVFGAVFFAAHPASAPATAFAGTLVVQAVILCTFLGVTFLVPARAREDVEVALG